MSMTAFILIGIIVIIVILVILSLLGKKTDKRFPERYSKSDGSPQKSPRVDTVEHSGRKKKVSYIYLSILNYYLEKYHLDCSEGSFFQLINLIIRDGKQQTLDRLKSELQAIRQVEDAKSKAEAAITLFESIEKEKIRLSIGLAPEDTTSPKIYKSAVEKYLADFDLTTLANNDLQKAMIALFNSLYDSGKMQSLRKFDVNLKWLRQYLHEGNNKKVEDILSKMMKEIDEYEREIG